MAVAPWYLLAGGIILVIVGYFITSLSSRGSGRVFITAKMTDEEVDRELNKDQGSPVGNLLMLAGFVIVFVSIVWRLVRMVISYVQ